MQNLNNFHIKEENLRLNNDLLSSSINESNFKTEINMFTFGSENIKMDEDDLDIKYLLLGMRD